MAGPGGLVQPGWGAVARTAGQARMRCCCRLPPAAHRRPMAARLSTAATDDAVKAVPIGGDVAAAVAAAAPSPSPPAPSPLSSQAVVPPLPPPSLSPSPEAVVAAAVAAAAAAASALPPPTSPKASKKLGDLSLAAEKARQVVEGRERERLRQRLLQEQNTRYLREEQKLDRQEGRTLVGVVVSAGRMKKTVKMRVQRKKLDKYLRKDFDDPYTVFVADPTDVAREGDVIVASQIPRKTERVRHLLSRVITPFSEPLEQRPAPLSVEHLLAKREEKRQAQIARRTARRVPRELAAETERIRLVAVRKARSHHPQPRATTAPNQNAGSGTGSGTESGTGATAAPKKTIRLASCLPAFTDPPTLDGTDRETDIAGLAGEEGAEADSSESTTASGSSHQNVPAEETTAADPSHTSDTEKSTGSMSEQGPGAETTEEVDPNPVETSPTQAKKKGGFMGWFG